MPIFFLDRLARGRGMGIDDPLALTAHIALVRRDILLFHRPGAEGGPLHGPAFIGGLFKIFKQDVGPGRLDALFGQRLHGMFQQDQIFLRIMNISYLLRRPSELANRIFQPTGQSAPDRPIGPVSQRKLHDRGRQGRILRIQRDKRRKRLQPNLHRTVRDRIFDPANRILAPESDAAETFLVQAAGLHLLALLDLKGKTLFDGRTRGHGVGVVRGAGVDRLVEDVPVPEPSVAAQIDLPGTDAAYWHADPAELIPFINGWFASLGQRGPPGRIEVFLRRDQFGVFRIGRWFRRRNGNCPSYS